MSKPPDHARDPELAPESLETSDQRDRYAGLSGAGRELLDAVTAAIQRMDHAHATQGLRDLEALAPEHPEVLRLQAMVLHARRRFGDAVRLLERARSQWPADAFIENDLGNALGAAGDIEGAVAAMRKCVELAPDVAVTWFNLARMLDLDARSEETLAALARALDCDPDHVHSRVLRARTLHLTGRNEEAVLEYRRAIALEPNSAKAWLGFSHMRTLRFDADDAGALLALYADNSLGEGERILAGFALAKALEDQDKPAQAFAVLSTANATMRRRLGWDASHFSARVDAIAKVFAAPRASAAQEGLGKEVIFIVGMPRSGSTLVERILAAHPQVADANELADLPGTLEEESARRRVDFPHWISQASTEDWERLGQRYLERTARRRERHPIFTDKGLLNWLYVGSILAMLPGARIVHCRRDPLQTCLSCYRHLFADEQAYCYDFHELTAFHRDHARLMQHWHDLFPGQIHDLSHENLLADPEREIHRLLEFCGLDSDPACLRLQELHHPVQTASADQVHEPLAADTAHADRYGALLAPVRRALAATSTSAP